MMFFYWRNIMNTSEKCVYWQHLLTAQARSGLTKAAFCQQEQLSLATFYYWAKKLNTEPSSTTPALIPLQLCAEVPTSAPASLTLTSPSGWQLSFPPSTAPETLRALLAVLA
jgi:hypothetical protein